MRAHVRCRSGAGALLVLTALSAPSCARDEAGAVPRSREAGAGPAAAAPVQGAAPTSAANRLVALLDSGRAAFGVFSGEQTPEQGARIVENAEADFVLYSMETGPFDVAAMRAYMAAMSEAAGAGALARHPVLLRVPPIGGDEREAGQRVSEALATDVAGIVFPHVADADDARRSVELMRDLWGRDSGGHLLDVIIVEDQEGIRNVRDIVATPGLSVVFAGPGDLRRAYQGDMEAVEAAIQAVLAACKEFEVACGVTAGAQDIAERLQQGFRVIIVTEPEALAVGLRASGRGG